jgi:hypothetical protein
MMCAQKTTNIAGAHDGTRKRSGIDVADWVAFSATPIFAIMAVLTAAVGSGSMDMHASPLTGMVTMYSLMSVVHSAHWLKLLYGR